MSDYTKTETETIETKAALEDWNIAVKAFYTYYNSTNLGEKERAREHMNSTAVDWCRGDAGAKVELRSPYAVSAGR